MMLPRFALALLGIPLLLTAAAGQPPGANYDESRVPPYTLPDPLVQADGTRVATADRWRSIRRPELLRLFETNVYGRTPASTLTVRQAPLERDQPALGGVALRSRIRIAFGPAADAPAMELLVYRPARAQRPVPAFLGLNFRGNHAVTLDPAVPVSTAWMPAAREGVVDHRATGASRGLEASRWPIARIVDRGFAVATAYYGDLDPDFDDGFRNGIHPLFYRPGQERPAPDEWGAIGAWAWGLSRGLDALGSMPGIDATRVAVLGHSRLGKAALWAGAQDERFAIVISNDSGAGGAALSKRIFGETVAALNTQFPHWFAGAFTRYDNREQDLPVDQHELLALVAPRPLYVASAAEDLWADPKGEFLGALHAEPVYRLLGKDGLGVTDMPPVDTPVGRTIGYHVRSGGHDVTSYDWERFMDFADRHMAGR